MPEIKKTVTETKKPIIVIITREEIVESKNVARTIIEKLKKVKIPVIDGLPIKVSSGYMTTTEDFDKDRYIYKWTP
jgi:hypothetical protein